MLKPGRYLARANSATLGKTSKGTEQVVVSFNVLAPESCSGERISWYGYFSEKTVDRTLEALEHCGWDGSSLSDLSGITTRDVEIVVEHEQDPEDADLIRARVRWVNAPGGASVKEKLSEAEAMILEERIKGKMLERKQRAASNPQPHPAPDGKDVPF